ncbi:hypothetical protein [Flavobacterium humi]|uniref:Uncharacterized protein n=1 Tax=Flavobacterium humi TaxID=2562683 RepID=A0A4Z0L5X7_9FLAO|nr:hypothetical protein [Flavobacterium humi]TGD57926.1 hypothetical protein E4635_07910 [Flavobacterium humi]
MKRKGQLFGIFLLLLLVFTIGLKGTFDGYYGFYYDKDDYEKPLAYELSNTIVELGPVSLFTAYTGFDTGYGFFAPNVASDFVLLFELRDARGNILEERIMPEFKSKEGIVRYTSVFNMFMDKVVSSKKKNDSQYHEYLDVVLKQIAKSVLKENHKAAKCTAKLYLYDYPTLDRYKRGEKTDNLILVSQIK